MSIVPDSRLGKIEFYEAHIAPWTTNAVAIGLTVPAVTVMSADLVAARNAYDAHVAALEASKAATLNFYEKVRTLHSAPGRGADMIDTIKAFAQSTGNPGVYVLAQIPAPQAPGKSQPPGTPANFAVGLLQNGALKLTWKCANPAGTQGTIYEVRRKVGAAPAFEFIGATGVRSFTDETHSGTSPVTYQITAVRSTARGAPAQFTVSFGIGGGGLMITSVEPPVKMAA